MILVIPPAEPAAKGSTAISRPWKNSRELRTPAPWKPGLAYIRMPCPAPGLRSLPFFSTR